MICGVSLILGIEKVILVVNEVIKIVDICIRMVVRI